MYRGGQLRDISEFSEVGVTTIQQFRHLGPFTHPLSSSPSVDHDYILGHYIYAFKIYYYYCYSLMLSLTGTTDAK